MGVLMSITSDKVSLSFSR